MPPGTAAAPAWFPRGGSAAALGVDGVLISPRCADPLYRRSVRVSMGTVFQVPWTRIPDLADGGAEVLRALGFPFKAE